MGRKKFRTEEEYKELRRQYYLQHREEILQKAKERKLHPTAPKKKKVKTETAYESLLNSWTEQLTKKLEENLPQWLEIAIRDQLIINKAMIINQDERQQQNKTGRKPNL